MIASQLRQLVCSSPPTRSGALSFRGFCAKKTKKRPFVRIGDRMRSSTNGLLTSTRYLSVPANTCHANAVFATILRTTYTYSPYR